MTEEFCLSENIKSVFDVDNSNWNDSQELIKIEDVKEFIRRLKESFTSYGISKFSVGGIIGQIDALAGGKLI